VKYRLGRHHDDTVYLQLGDEPSEHDERVAVFTRSAGEAPIDALHYVRAMNATMPDCTCPVVCHCGELVGNGPSGCETCAEHEIECWAETLTRRRVAGLLLDWLAEHRDWYGSRPATEGRAEYAALHRLIVEVQGRHAQGRFPWEEPQDGETS
jgi:hypothetical protein